MRLPAACGPLSAYVRTALQGTASGPIPDQPRDALADRDLQLALWCLYELHYRGFDDVPTDLEWDPDLLRIRQALERPFERALRAAVAPRLSGRSRGAGVADDIFALIAEDRSPSVAAYLHRHASTEQFHEFLRQRSIYHRKESDPQAFVVPRLDGPAKVALAELQYDEFGAGRVAGLHATLFGDALEGCGLEAAYGAYIEECTGPTLAINNAMSLFGLHRRLRGAAMGHLAAFEATSSLPSRKISGGAARLGLPPSVAAYYDEHVEADAVHEQLAARDICGSLVAEDPRLYDDVLLGVAACLELDARAAQDQLSRWGAVDQELPA